MIGPEPWTTQKASGGLAGCPALSAGPGGAVILVTGSGSMGAGSLVCQAHPAPPASRDSNQVAAGNASHIAWTIAAVN